MQTHRLDLYPRARWTGRRVAAWMLVLVAAGLAFTFM